MSNGPGRLRNLARRIPGALPLGRFLHRLYDSDIRAVHRLRKRHALELFQPYPDTYEDRYPELFARLAELLADRNRPEILSFGCSSGAEVRALRRVMPKAVITGIDLNPAVIAQARKADQAHAESYIVAGRPPPDRPYDAILALAVFRHGILERYRPDSCAAHLPFARFDEGVRMLDMALRPGGYLAIFNAHFRLEDSAVADRYVADPLRLTGQPPQNFVYGPDDRRIDGDANFPLLFCKRVQQPA